jgi:hypothetical protein
MAKSVSRTIVQMPMLLQTTVNILCEVAITTLQVDEAVPNVIANENGNEARSLQKDICGGPKLRQNSKQESLLVTYKCHSEACNAPRGKVKKKPWWGQHFHGHKIKWFHLGCAHSEL